MYLHASYLLHNEYNKISSITITTLDETFIFKVEHEAVIPEVVFLHMIKLSPVFDLFVLPLALPLLDHLDEGDLGLLDQRVPHILEGDAEVIPSLHHVLDGVLVVVVHAPGHVHVLAGTAVEAGHVVGQVDL